MHRRTALKGGLVLAITAHTTAGIAIAADPVIETIDSYRKGLVEFCKIKEEDWPSLGGEDVVTKMTYGAAQNELDNWSQPCTSMTGAIAALRFALKESEDFYCEPAVTSMIKAALGYLETVNA
ncbi:hypothetical protein ACQZ46_02665 [Agrobacterium salinitolerans]